ncbi:MAG TPA: methyltransferase domain-containing protein [Chitinophagaceae bacterium]|nr:methyltransferase domain-containing protein [Chitinophagaceae bacterium]
MSAIQTELVVYHIGHGEVRLWQPVPRDVPRPEENAAALYWARIWPSAIALAHFLARHPQWVQGKNVLELGAGLGLPSLVAARFASRVCCTDLYAEAVMLVARSAKENRLENITCQMLDWEALPGDLAADVLLLSDVNYEQDSFPRLYEMLLRFLKQGATILLTTPRRLMAKPFISQLLPFAIHQEGLDEETANPLSLFILRADSMV